ncbi:MAG: tRNA (adenosine(37)-N6)-threonylcarbamoyltransferase complex ATPase subunit type 1 TsaE [Treponemataceae bacterium]
MLELYSASSDKTIEIGEKFGSKLKAGDIVAYEGTLAAGKTTFTKGIAKALKIDEDVTSPTFTLISEYEGRLPLYHFDAYRLDGAESFIDIGAEEFMYGKGVCAIEWTENIKSAIPSNAIKVCISILAAETRKITIENWPYENIFGEYLK